VRRWSCPSYQLPLWPHRQCIFGTERQKLDTGLRYERHCFPVKDGWFIPGRVVVDIGHVWQAARAVTMDCDRGG